VEKKELENKGEKGKEEEEEEEEEELVLVLHDRHPFGSLRFSP